MDMHEEGKKKGLGLPLWQVGLLAAAFLAGLSVSRLILAAQALANCPVPNFCSSFGCPCGWAGLYCAGSCGLLQAVSDVHAPADGHEFVEAAHSHAHAHVEAADPYLDVHPSSRRISITCKATYCMNLAIGLRWRIFGV